MSKRWILGLGLIGITLFAIACSASPTPTPTSPPAPTKVAEQPTVAPTSGPTAEPVPTEAAIQIPFAQEWAGSGHADGTAEAFVHWNEESPAEVPDTCAKCHSTPGYQDFLGADGSEAGKVDKPAPIGTTINCVACHNSATAALNKVTFPSGLEVSGLGREARCMVCHQGRASGKTVDDKIAAAKLADDDTPSEDLGFTNIHYFAAAATEFGTLAKGGYEYPGQTYDARTAHVTGYDTCVGCHNPHTLEVKVEDCKTCHEGVTSKEDLKNVRMAGSKVDYDGDGNVDEGIYDEMNGMRDMLYTAIQAYAKDTAGKAIVYTPDANPYFFIDTNGDGKADKDETVSANKYNAWTARLAKAAYNYQISVKDPGAFAHGGKYIIELMYDSIVDLNVKLATPIDLSKANRIDSGHFAGSQLPFRDWDEAGKVPGTCAKCHSAVGLPQFVAEGTTISAPISNGFKCETCHVSLTDFTRLEVKTVKFPSGAVVDSGNPDTNICISCHQGRESTTSVNALIKGIEPDAQNEKLRFLNIHYFAAGATLFGDEVKGAYQFTDKTYLGRNEHKEKFNDCIECHDTHALTAKVSECAECHDGVTEDPETVRLIRESEIDFNGNGDVKEGLDAEITSFKADLYAAIQAYAKDTNGAPIAYSSASYPYFFNDLNGNGSVDADEATRENGYNKWTPRLLQSAYNYQYASKDPGAFAHNGKYIIQVLFDSIENVGGDVTGKTRPETPAP